MHSTDPTALSLAEQLFLLAVDPGRGRVRTSPAVFLAMAGGVLLDLTGDGVCTLTDRALVVADAGAPTRVPAELRDGVLGELAARGPKRVKFWVHRLAAPRFRLGQRVGASLVERGVLTAEPYRRLGLFPAVRHRLQDERARRWLVDLCRSALRTGEPPERLAGLLTLAHACELTGDVLDGDAMGRDERKQAKRRLADLARAHARAGIEGDISSEVHQQIRAAVTAQVMAATTSAISDSGHSGGGHHGGGHHGGAGGHGGH